MATNPASTANTQATTQEDDSNPLASFMMMDSVAPLVPIPKSAVEGQSTETQKNAETEHTAVPDQPLTIHIATEDGSGGMDFEDEEEDEPTATPSTSSSAPRQKLTLGRRKINIAYIKDKNKRHITFSKRKSGIMKKAYELSTLTGTQVLLLVASETGHVYTFATSKLQPIITQPEGKNLIQACLSNTHSSSSTSSSSSGAKSKGKSKAPVPSLSARNSSSVASPAPSLGSQSRTGSPDWANTSPLSSSNNAMNRPMGTPHHFRSASQSSTTSPAFLTPRSSTPGSMGSSSTVANSLHSMVGPYGFPSQPPVSLSHPQDPLATSYAYPQVLFDTPPQVQQMNNYPASQQPGFNAPLGMNSYGYTAPAADIFGNLQAPVDRQYSSQPQSYPYSQQQTSLPVTAALDLSTLPRTNSSQQPPTSSYPSNNLM